MTYITSRGFELPETADDMADSFWFNMWTKRLWPYRDLKAGDLLYWYESPTKAIRWKSRVTKVDQFEYANKRDAAKRIVEGFQDFDKSYFKNAPDSGYCVAWSVEPIEHVNWPRPEGFKFALNGWMRVADVADVWPAVAEDAGVSIGGNGVRHFGHVPGIAVGAHFANRRALADSGIHKPLQHGISASAAEGADSIVVSGGYEDDEDFGDELIFTGAGGRDPATGLQIGPQELRAQNLGLARSRMTGLPVRVVRGASGDGPDLPGTGYRYDGLFRVDDYWSEIGQSGHLVWRYRLVSVDRPPADVPKGKKQNGPAPRADVLATRIIRDTAVSIRVKKLHDYRCQVCGLRLDGPTGPYAEAAHIKPLGRPHNGPDVVENVLCLCPNHHVLFDMGALAVDNHLRLIGLRGELRTCPRHTVGSEYLAYHRASIADRDTGARSDLKGD